MHEGIDAGGLSWAVAEVEGDVSCDNFLKGRITRACRARENHATGRAGLGFCRSGRALTLDAERGGDWLVNGAANEGVVSSIVCEGRNESGSNKDGEPC